MQVLLTAPGGIVDDLPSSASGSARLVSKRDRAAESADGGADVIEIRDLTVRFGGVVPIDRHERHHGRRHERADRPERCRQDHVLQRAQRASSARPPARSPRSATTCWRCPTSSASAGGCAARSRPSRRSPTSRCYENVLLVHEHSGRRRATRRDDVVDAVEFVGLGHDDQRLGRHAGRGRATTGRGRPRRRRASPGWSCSTSPRPACPTTRPQRSARSSSRSPIAPARSWSWSTTTWVWSASPAAHVGGARLRASSSPTARHSEVLERPAGDARLPGHRERWTEP